MTITSFAFLLFAFSVLILYYLVPPKSQWKILLLASMLFYCICCKWRVVYVIASATTIFFAVNAMQSILDRQKAYFQENKGALSKEERQKIKAANQKKRKAIMLAALFFNLGVLFVFKYSHFVIDSVNPLLSKLGGFQIDQSFSWIVPLGLSFYTFQATGYLLDVYWEYYKPTKNYFKTLLFVSFFPQMTQGPISDFEQLSAELFSEHRFEYKNYAWGFQRMIWGFTKKMVIADTLSPWVKDVFANYPHYSGIAVLIGAFLYSIQIYADFSGYMDIMCGYCEMLGIRLSENFERPYFSKSIEEYWRRWHITLGAWFKKYIYYPMGTTKWSRSLAKKTRERFGKTLASTVPATIALVVTWLATGLWHGASWAYVVWGLVNGAFIILQLWLGPVYKTINTRLRIDEHAFSWRAFQVIRTFILITFIKVLPEVGTLSDGLGLWARIFTEHTFRLSYENLFPFLEGTVWWQNLIVAGLIAVWFCISLIQRKAPAREKFNRLPPVIRFSALVGLFLVISYIGVIASLEGGFMYAGF